MFGFSVKIEKKDGHKDMKRQGTFTKEVKTGHFLMINLSVLR